MNRFIYFLLLTACININAVAADDPMVSLFKFQSQMAKSGNADAMMKLGEMYEQGVGTKQNLDKALEMYRQAQAKGTKGAVAAIKRVEKTIKYGSASATKAAAQQAARENAMRDKAAREKLAREKAVRDKAAREKAAKEKAAREQAAAEKAAQEEAARKKAEEKKTFTTDPCDTPAARFMSSCRKKK